MVVKKTAKPVKAKKEKKKGGNKSKIFKDTLKVILTKEETAAYSEQLAKDSIDLRENEEHKKEVAANFTADSKKLETSISSLSRKVSSGEEWRPVDCQWLFNFKTGKKRKVRLDTGEELRGEELRVEDITNEDRQTKLKLIN